MTLVAEPGVKMPARRSRTEWILLAIPQVILGGGMLLMLVVHPNAVKSGLMSTRAILVNTALLGGWLLLSFVILPRLVRNVLVRAAILTALAIIGVVVLVVPTLHDTKVVETFPGVAAPERDEASASSAPASEVQVAPAPVVAAPTKVSSASLHGIDHDATGTASVYRQPDGSFVVALEDIDVEPGPDYHVWVVPGRDRRSPGDGIELAKLRGNQGTQYYEVPRDAPTDLGTDWTVLIWCRAFGVPVANATQD